MPRKNSKGAKLVAGTILGLGVLWGFTCEFVQREFGPPEKVCLLKSEEIDESSGITPSLLLGGYYWTHNDDGESLELFRFDLKGATQKWTLPRVPNRDVEAMSSLKFDGHNYLFLADIGDNNEHHESIWVTAIEEPVKEGSDPAFTRYELKYPDRPHNAEAFFVDASGTFWIITKSSSEAIIFSCNRLKGSEKLVKRGAIRIQASLGIAKQVTDAAISRDGRFIIVRTYTGAYEYSMPKSGEWWTSKPTPVNLPLEIQGEAICYAADGKALLTTSEGKPCSVGKVPLK